MDSESLDELNLSFKELRSLFENLDTKVQILEAKAGQLAAAYVIFHAILYIQVILPTAAAFRRDRWIPVGLSALVSIAFWLTFITTVNDCMRSRQQKDSTFMEQERLYRKMYSIRTGRTQNDAQQSLSKPLAIVRRRRYAYVGALHSALFSFTLLVSYALFSIPRLR